MTRFVAFLSGVNLGRRTTRSADLIAAFAAIGLPDARTLIASGNVLFEADDDADLGRRIEVGLENWFRFEIGVVLRSHAELETMVQRDPFGQIPSGADAKLYVGLLREPVGRSIPLPYGVPGDFDVLAVTDTEIFAIAWPLPNGRYGAGLDTLGRQLPKGTLLTMRNWNTILKAAG